MMETVFRILMFWVYVASTESLVCYDCKNITDYSACSTHTTCGPDESCFMDRTGANITLGCVSNKQCNINAGSDTTIIGSSVTSRQDQRCHECCSTDNCAVQLCSHQTLASSCIDDETLDCARLNTLFDICSDESRAKSVCPRFCGVCVVDGNWSAWTTWTKCSVTCENGTQSRTRKCNNPSPAHGGKDCQGTGTELKQCVRELCPVHGGWNDWMPWGTCSATCGVGMKRRYRNCTNPVPIRFGDHCYGDSIEDKLCFPGACTDGGWSTWNGWSNCSIVSGYGGFKTRFRSCSSPNPSPYGKNCVGNPMQITACVSSDCSYRDCVDVKNASPTAKTGIYSVCLWKTKTKVDVFCDMTTDGGGWTVFQKRFNGSVEFYKSFTEYENGFGYINGEFWLGLKNIQEIASIGNTELRINLTAANGNHTNKVFQGFSLSPGRAYTLHYDNETGATGSINAGLLNNQGVNFFTEDYDNQHNCAERMHGGWWYGNCGYTNLNGHYEVPGTTSSFHNGYGGVIYYAFKGVHSLKSTSMMLRRIN